MIRPRAFAGLALCAFLLGATWPVLAALPSVPARVVAGDAFAITQGSGALSINVSLASNLSASNWTVTVSPEILGLSVLDGDSVVVRSPEISNPIAVRYCWVNFPDGCNLFNKAGLPAAQFRTDAPKGEL